MDCRLSAKMAGAIAVALTGCLITCGLMALYAANRSQPSAPQTYHQRLATEAAIKALRPQIGNAHLADIQAREVSDRHWEVSGTARQWFFAEPWRVDLDSGSWQVVQVSGRAVQ